MDEIEIQNHIKEKRLDNYGDILKQAILERYRSLSIISTISFAFLGVIIFSLDGDIIKTKLFLFLSFGALILVSLVSLWRYIWLLRKDIIALSKSLEEFSGKKSEGKDYWVESLFFSLVISLMFFALSLFRFNFKGFIYLKSDIYYAVWLEIAGICFNFLGSFFLVKGLFITKKGAIEFGRTKWAGNTDEENLNLPAVKDRLEQRKNGVIGAIFIFIGTVLQILSRVI